MPRELAPSALAEQLQKGKVEMCAHLVVFEKQRVRKPLTTGLIDGPNHGATLPYRCRHLHP